ncbi:MAG: O-antigen ligase family protein [Elusimicrobiales bacterium]|nr:O-antigen ligase family protein [Elusimicrobiales bacterium]
MADPQDNFPVSRGLLAVLLGTAFFVSPLLFFTGLTRNPYYLQIVLLNVSLLGAAALFVRASLRLGAWQLRPTPLSVPLAALALVYLVSFLFSYFGHAAFFRPAMAAEGLRAGLFFLVNCLGAFYLARSLPFSGDDDVRAGGWLALILGWGALWFLFPFVRATGGGDGLLDRLTDPYGLLVWTAGFTAVWLLIRRVRQEDILHLALSAGAIASLYGILEYFHVELVWAKLVNPYGNRAVSTFGNPNFISSYVVVLLPLAASLLMKADTRVKRFYYGLVFLSYEGMLMCSLTRSSWIGAAAAFIFLFSFASHRKVLKANRRFLYPFFAAALALAVLWPADSLKPFSSGLVERVAQVTSGVGGPSAVSLSGDGGKIYSSFHQRLLIWTSAWQMGLESPLLGKGWGQFELFYPFYQGRLLLNFPVIRNLRTHANNAHNEVLEQWSQAGLIGLGVYLWFLALLFYGFLRFYRAAGEEARYGAVPLAAGLAGMLADNMLNVSLHFAVPALAFWWVAGALSLKISGQTTPCPAWRRPAAARGLAWLLLAACLAGAWFWQRQFMREFHYFNGFRLMRVGNVAAAARELDAAWRSHSREVNSNYEMANAYVRSGDLDKGAWAYGEALKSNAGYDEIYFNTAIVLKRLGRLDQARAYLQTSTIINPLNRQAWQAIAEIHLAAPDKAAAAPAAIADMSEAVRAFPHDATMWNTLGYFRMLAKDYKGARDAYGSGAKAEPENRMLGENLAGVSRQLGVKDDPDLAWLASYGRLASALASQQPDERLLARADALVAAAPGSLRALSLRAKLLFKAGRLDAAAADLQAVLAADYADNSARYGLAVIYEKKGDIQAARAQWHAFLDLEPGNSAVAARMKALADKP